MTNQKILKIAAALFVALAFPFCTGTSNLSTDSGGANSVTPSQGRVIDSPIQGLQYSTATQTGLTDANGSYKYLPGEQVTFSIGKTVLGTATASAFVTPENLSVTGLNDQKVKNILRFLQTVDADGVHENGIEIKQAVRDLLAGTSINLSQGTAAFDADNIVKAVIQVSRGAATPLVAEATAVANFLSYRFSGSFSDNYGGQHFLTATLWQLKDTWTNQTDTIVKINGLANYIIIQKSAADAFNASKFQKIIYISNNDGSFYTCTLSPFNSSSSAAAEAITDSTAKTDPANTGCGGFAWTKMSPAGHPLIGKWSDPYAGKHTIDVSTWIVDFGTPATDAILRYNFIDSYLIIQKPAGDAFNPSKYQKVVITQSNGAWFFCTLSPFNSATADAAAAIVDGTTKTSPATTGCSGFSWTQLLP